MSDVRIETVTKLQIEPGDILHVKLGGEIGDGQPPWIPTPEDVQHCYDLWAQVLPTGTGLVVTHHLVDDTVIQKAQRVTHWPPKHVMP